MDFTSVAGIATVALGLTGVIIYLTGLKDDRMKMLLNAAVVVVVGIAAAVTGKISIDISAGGLLIFCIQLLAATGISKAEYAALKLRPRK